MAYKNKETERTHRAGYYIANRWKILAKNLAYRSENREKIHSRNAIYRATNREKERSRKAAWIAANPEKKRFYNAAYRATHSEKERAYAAAYQRAHPVEKAFKDAKRRALKLAATIGDPAEIKAVYRRARENKRVRCYLCGELIPLGARHVDHVMPLARGGKHTASNLAIACARCNLSKNAKMPEDVGLLL